MFKLILTAIKDKKCEKKVFFAFDVSIETHYVDNGRKNDYFSWHRDGNLVQFARPGMC